LIAQDVHKYGNGIMTSVILLGKDRVKLGIGQDGVLDIPRDVTPNAFSLILLIPEKLKCLVAQKNVGEEKGGYHQHALVDLGNLVGYKTVVMRNPIQVLRKGQKTWTAWHQEEPNRLDCWIIGPNGRLDLFQVGVVTHDNGRSFKLIGDYRWMGQLFDKNRSSIVGKPLSPIWGGFENRKQILDLPEFKKLLNGTGNLLLPWSGKENELNPPLSRPKGPGLATVDWYNPFAGQTGQGIVLLHDGSNAWLHGIDILSQTDPDGVKRLWRGQSLQYVAIIQNWGSKKDGPPKISGAKKISTYTPTTNR